MFRNLFNPDSALMITMTQITDCIFLSLFWLMCCFPVVTVGAAGAALYDATVRCFRWGEKNPWQRYLYSFKQNLKPGILPSLTFLVVGGGAVWLGIRTWNAAVYGQLSWGVFAAVAFLLLVLVGALGIMFPLFSRFETTTGRLWSNTFRLALANLPLTMGVALINAFALFCYVRWVIPLFFLPCLAALLSSLMIEPMLKPFMPEEAGEE